MSHRSSRAPEASPWARPTLSGLAALGCLGCAYLTWVKLGSRTALCPTQGCETVLNSSYAQLWGLPLSLFGLGSYGLMLLLAAGVWLVPPEGSAGGSSREGMRSRLDRLTWWGLFGLSTAMGVFSLYLMALLITDLQVLCLYCLGSALVSLGLWLTVLLGRRWTDWGQLGFAGLLIALVVGLGSLAFNAQAQATVVSDGFQGRAAGAIAQTSSPGSSTRRLGGKRGAAVTTHSSEAALGLAQHLATSGAKMYGAYWCPHCQDQKALFGQEAMAVLPYVECDAKGFQGDPQACRAAGIDGYPTWIINGQVLSGTQDLEVLAQASGYAGADAVVTAP